MRYELTDHEWSVIKPMLPNKPRGVPRVDDRRVPYGISWVLRSGALRRDLPESCAHRTTCCSRFVRSRQAGVWDRIIEALAAAHDAAVQMIETSSVRVHRHGLALRVGRADSQQQTMRDCRQARKKGSHDLFVSVRNLGALGKKRQLIENEARASEAAHALAAGSAHSNLDAEADRILWAPTRAPRTEARPSDRSLTPCSPTPNDRRRPIASEWDSACYNSNCDTIPP